jgi:hypothetical protein
MKISKNDKLILHTIQIIQDLIDKKLLPRKIFKKGLKINTKKSKRALEGFNPTQNETIATLHGLISSGIVDLDEMKKYIKFMPDDFLKGV